MSAATSRPRPDPVPVWERTVVGWHVAFAAILVIAVLAALTVGDARPGHRAGSVAALAVLAVAYWLVGVRAPRVRDVPWVGDGYLAVLCVVVFVVVVLDPSVTFMLFIGYPQVWFICESVRRGVVWTALLTATATLGFLVRYGWTDAVLRDVGPTMLVSLLFSLALGLWISRVIDQSQQRADLIAELDRTRDELAEAHHAAGVVAERERMAQEIHDTLAQGFTSIVALAQAGRVELERDRDSVSRRLEAIETTARDNLAEARALVAAFAPVGLADGGLAGALRRLTERFTAETGVPVELEVPADPPELGRDTEVVLLRAAQEALTNVRRHADASRVVLRLTGTDAAGAGVEITDDGRGFDAASAAGFGLSGMRHRVEGAGGSLELESAPGAGTRVRVELPAAVSR